MEDLLHGFLARVSYTDSLPGSAASLDGMAEGLISKKQKKKKGKK